MRTRVGSTRVDGFQANFRAGLYMSYNMYNTTIHTHSIGEIWKTLDLISDVIDIQKVHFYRTGRRGVR